MCEERQVGGIWQHTLTKKWWQRHKKGVKTKNVALPTALGKDKETRLKKHRPP
jgi:hypothetical protein